MESINGEGDHSHHHGHDHHQHSDKSESIAMDLESNTQQHHKMKRNLTLNNRSSNIVNGSGNPSYNAASYASDDSTHRNKSRLCTRVGFMRMRYQLSRFFTIIWNGKDSRKIMIFLSLNLMFMFVEIVVGFWTNSLGLISDAGHMFFDCGSLFLGLFATVVVRLKHPDSNYMYGYSRSETLAGFVNGIFLIFVAVFVFLESIERMTIPHDMNTEGLLVTAVVGFLVNVVGLVFFHDHAHSHGGNSNHDHSHHGHSHGSNSNMHGVYLHVLADALGSGGVIVSSLLVEYRGLTIADPICSFCISILIFASAMPLITETAETLLNMIPRDKVDDFENCLTRIHNHPGVLQIRDPHLWTLSSQIYVSSLIIVADDSSSIDKQEISRFASNCLREVGVAYPTVQVCTSSTMSAILHESRHPPGVEYQALIWKPRDKKGDLHGCSHSHDHGHSHDGHGHSHDGWHHHGHEGLPV